MNEISANVGCSLEQEVLMTGTMADRTASSIRALRAPGDASPEKQKRQ